MSTGRQCCSKDLTVFFLPLTAHNQYTEPDDDKILSERRFFCVSSFEISKMSICKKKIPRGAIFHPFFGEANN